MSLALVPGDGSGDPVAPWVSVTALQADPRLSALSVDDLTVAAEGATETLWALSGRQFGGLRTAEILVIPPDCSCDTGVRTLDRLQMGANGGWPVGWVFGCMCHAEIVLPDRPVDSVTEVSIDGTVLDPAGYRLDDNAILVRTDGSYWPLIPTGVTDVATPRLRISYLWGLDAPAGGVIAARIYATEVALALAGSSDCRLPDNVTSITRQDLIKTFADPLQLVQNGLTGISAVDTWVASVNPHRHSGSRPRVLSPDLPRIRRT